MFQLEEKIERWYPVTLELQSDEGRKRSFNFDARFRVVDQTVVENLLGVGTGASANDAELCDAVLIGWRGVQDSDGSDLGVTPENRARFLNIVGVRRAIALAWLRMVGIEGKTKN